MLRSTWIRCRRLALTSRPEGPHPGLPPSRHRSDPARPEAGPATLGLMPGTLSDRRRERQFPGSGVPGGDV